MRSPLLTCAILLAFCLPAAAPLSAQEPAKIIDQYVKAAGGAGKLSKAKSLSLEGTLTRASDGKSDGKSGSFTLDLKSPNRYYLELLLGEQPEILAYNGKSAWQVSSTGEASTLLEQDALQMEASGLLANSHLLDLHKNKIGVAFIGPAKLGSSDTLQLELTMPTGVKRQFFFDARTHLLRKEAGTIANAPLEITYDDYRAEDGIQVAHKLQLRRSAELYDV